MRPLAAPAKADHDASGQDPRSGLLSGRYRIVNCGNLTSRLSTLNQPAHRVTKSGKIRNREPWVRVTFSIASIASREKCYFITTIHGSTRRTLTPDCWRFNHIHLALFRYREICPVQTRGDYSGFRGKCYIITQIHRPIVERLLRTSVASTIFSRSFGIARHALSRHAEIIPALDCFQAIEGSRILWTGEATAARDSMARQEKHRPTAYRRC